MTRDTGLHSLFFRSLCLKYSRSFSLFLLAGSLLAGSAGSQQPPAASVASHRAGELRFVAMVTRHGVRSPTGRIEQINQYSAQPWPQWNVPAGNLTAHGFELMRIMGAYYRQMYSAQGLLQKRGCSDAEQIRIVADSDQRTRETGRALALGLAPECNLTVSALAEGTPDPLFHSLEAGVGNPDRELAATALAGRIGGDPEGLTAAYRTQLTALEKVLEECPQTAVCNAQKPHSLFEISGALAPGKSDHIADLRSPLGLASTITENFLLEYSEGMDAAQVGWGRVNLETLRGLLQLHVAQEDLTGRTSAIARPQASNLLHHLLQSIDQAADGKWVAGALSKASDRMLILSGHDTNQANIAGALQLNWIVDGRRDDTPPGGALVFELWKMPGAGGWEVRTYYVAQTLDQMRHATPLTLETPPQRVPVFIPGCGQTDGFCSLSGFKKTVEAAVDMNFVR